MTTSPITSPVSRPVSPSVDLEQTVGGSMQGRAVAAANLRLTKKVSPSESPAQNLTNTSLAERTIEIGKPSAGGPSAEGATGAAASVPPSKKPSAEVKELPQYISEDKKIPGALKITTANKAEVIAQIMEEVGKIRERTTLSTTGYITAGKRIANDRPDNNARMSKVRAEQYQNTAKAKFPEPNAAVAGLAKIQQHVNTPSTTNKLSSPIHMSVDELTEAVVKARENGFANCDLQALETGNQLYHNLGIKDFTLYSNESMSHNYVALDQRKKSDELAPDQAKHSDGLEKQIIVDSWMGTDVADFNEMGAFSRLGFNKAYNHKPENLTVNENMHQWIEKEGAAFAEIT